MKKLFTALAVASMMFLSIGAHSKILGNKIAANKIAANGVKYNGLSQAIDLRDLAQAPLVKTH